MTILMSKPTEDYRWASMPGWAVVADLTPPEVLAGRRLVVLRRLVGAGLVLVLLLCAGGYVLARRSYDSAHRQVDAATAQTTQLTVQQGRYTRVTQIQAATASTRSQLESLMGTDVDTAKLIAQLLAALPQGATVSSLNLDLGGTTGSETSTGSGTGATASIGTATLVGTARSLDDLAIYAARLGAVPGVTDVVPTDNSAGSKTSTTWTLTLDVNSKRYSHRFGDAVPTSSPPATTATGGN